MGEALIVLGMHRSGTSALTGVLGLLGVSLGNKLTEAREDNPKGFWEHSDVVSVHNRFLDRVGSSSSDVRVFPKSIWRGTPAIKAKEALTCIIEEHFLNADLWGLKDPRMCRLLPLWHEIFEKSGTDPLYILTVRHPYEVAQSLEKRDGIPFHTALLLWLLHCMEAIVETQDQRRVFVSYESLMRDWRSALDRVSQTFDIKWPLSMSSVESRVSDFIDCDLRHHSMQDAERAMGSHGVESILIEWVLNVYKIFIRATEDKSSSIEPAVYGIYDELVDKINLLDEVEPIDRGDWFARGFYWDVIKNLSIKAASANANLNKLTSSKVFRILNPFFRFE